MHAEYAAAVALGVLPDRAKLALSGRRPVRLDGDELQPGIQLILRMMALRGGASLISSQAVDPVSERRRVCQMAARSRGRPTSVGAVRELLVDGSRGPLRARHYAPPAPAAAAPLLLFAHGGGWVVGDLDTHDEICRMISRHSAVHVLSVEYSLAPEHPFPAAVEDVVAAAGWALRHAEQLGADPKRVALGGDSAGGNLVAVACQELAGRSARQPALQVLIYPSTDFAEVSRSKALFSDGLFLDAWSREWCQRRYFGPEVDLADPRLSPLRGDLDGLPPAIVLTAAFDPLRDEGEAYAAALEQAGSPVMLYRVPGMIHGFMNMTAVNRAARDATLHLAGMIRAELAVPSF